MAVKTVKLSDFTSKREIAAGGEGKIYEHPSDSNKVVKIYHQARKAEFKDHLIELLDLPYNMFVIPEDIYIDANKKVLGFSMPYVNFNNYWLFNNLFNKGFCNSNSIDEAFKIKVLDNLKKAIEVLHKELIVVGDLNQYNIFVSKQADILFVDTDSYATSKQSHSGVLLDDIRDWTTTAINSQTDIYAYDVLSFWATTFCHPYKWVVPGNKESLEQRVRANKSILSNIQGIKIPPLYQAPVGDVLKQFTEIFNNGRRYMISFTGTYTPVNVVIKQVVPMSNNLTIRELYQDITDINVCDTSIAIKIDKVWKMVETAIPKITRETLTINCDELYPAGKEFAYTMGDTLYATKSGWSKTFQQPVFYYNNGMLTVIEYPRNIQWNFNIANQLGGGIDNTNTPVFSKSIIKRSGLLQNFGSQKYLNVPYLNRYSMIPVPKGTKDGFLINGYIGIEVKNKNTVEFFIVDTKDTKKSIEFDYLPYFAVALGGTMLVPEDGFINVYSNLQLLTKLECSMCTRDSKLYYTKSGILLLENKTLYLLNTK